MDTNLKQSKKIRAFLYRVITFCAFFTLMATIVLGREAFQNLKREGYKILTGNIYYLTDFREYISKLYTQSAIALCGIADDMGHPFSGAYSKQASADAKNAFEKAAAQSENDLIYYIIYAESYTATKTMFIKNITYPLFSEYDNHLLLPEDVQLCTYWDGPADISIFFDQIAIPDPENEQILINAFSEQYYQAHYMPNPNVAPSIRILIAVRDNGTYESYFLKQLDNKAKGYANILWTALISGIVFLLFAPLCLFTGKASTAAKEAYAKKMLILPFELKLFPAIALGIVCFNLHLWHFNGAVHWRIVASNYLYFYPIFALFLYLFWIAFREHQLTSLRNSFLFGIGHYFCKFFTRVVWKRKALLLQFWIVLCSLVMVVIGTYLVRQNGYWYRIFSSYHENKETAHIRFVLGCILVAVGVSLFIVSLLINKFIRDTGALTDKIALIQAGQESKPLALSKHSLLKETGEALNNIEDGIEAAIEERNRSNQMRVDLITNVSHDLKTPLTSIINYADLLCEENLSEPCDEYALALRDKAYRLKKMVQDVFELSKATSGNLPVELAELDLGKLVEQTLADMDERIQESSLSLKTYITEEPLPIFADGEKLYRIFQNLLVNALQYSLSGSRIHVYVYKEGDLACAKIKNTSKQELDFDTEKIVERFVRADASRTTEGSGLGLSIVQSFTEACGGTFHVETDADMFIAIVKFPLI